MNSTLLPVIDAALCDGCGVCVTHCSTGALGLVEGLAVLAYPARCNYDAACEGVCPAEAIALPYQVVFESPQG